MQGRNRVSDIENRYVDTVGEGEVGMNWESSVETYIALCEIDSLWEVALQCRELPVCSVMT